MSILFAALLFMIPLFLLLGVSYIHDYAGVVDLQVSIAPAAARTGAGTDNGASCDMLGDDAECHAVLTIGTVGTDATDTLSVQIQESSTGTGGWVNISGAVLTANGGSTANSAFAVSFLRNLRFLRAVGTRVSGNSATFVYGVNIGEQKKYI